MQQLRNAGSRIRYDQRSWFNIHTKTHHLLYLGLPFIFKLYFYKWSLELFSNHRPNVGGCVHTQLWVGFYFHTHPALTTLPHHCVTVKW